MRLLQSTIAEARLHRRSKAPSPKQGTIAEAGHHRRSKATVYIPFVEAIKAVMEPGYYFDITATVDGSTLTCKKTFTSSKTIERDKVYTINATFE